MDENAGSQLGQYNIRFSWEIRAMDPETVAMKVQKLPDNHFRIGVLTFDAAHHARSCGAVDDVHFVISQNRVVS